MAKKHLMLKNKLELLLLRDFFCRHPMTTMTVLRSSLENSFSIKRFKFCFQSAFHLLLMLKMAWVNLGDSAKLGRSRK